MAFWKNNNHPHGQLLVEILIAIGVFVIFAGTFMLFAVDASRFTTRNTEALQGTWLGTESYDALNDIWSQSFSLLANGTYGLVVNGENKWSLATTPDVHGNLKRQIIIHDGMRNTSGSLAIAGTPDANTKKITATVVNTTTNATIFSDTYYFSNMDALPIANLSWLQTTRGDFIGTHDDTQRTDYNGGAVTLRTNRTQGTFTSQVFNTESTSTTYSQLIWHGLYSQLSNIRIQIRVGTTTGQVNGATFFGPDGTSNSYFAPSDSIIIPPGVQGTQRIQYQVHFEKTGTITPLLEDIEIFYAL